LRRSRWTRSAAAGFGGLQGLREDVGWFFPASTGGGAPFDAHSTNTSSSANLIATLFATWHLMRQPGIAETTEEMPDKAIRRAYARVRRPIPAIRVVNLRKRAKAPRTGEAPAGARASWSYRVLVGAETGGFWRTYWTGPGRTVKEPRWIEPYLTGDDGMPLKEDLDMTVVKTLR
jgi:hypothetical protein